MKNPKSFASFQNSIPELISLELQFQNLGLLFLKCSRSGFENLWSISMIKLTQRELSFFSDCEFAVSGKSYEILEKPSLNSVSLNEERVWDLS